MTTYDNGEPMPDWVVEPRPNPLACTDDAIAMASAVPDREPRQLPSGPIATLTHSGLGEN